MGSGGLPGKFGCYAPFMDEALIPLRKLAHAVCETAAETLWPTRCALCDTPGDVLCDACARSLPFLDWWRACPRCGAVLGAAQCDFCNPIALGRIGRDELPFAGCASATLFSAATGQLVRTYKDQGEQRLASVLARFMARVVPPAWRFEVVTFIPATKAAYRHRGFDHAELLAGHVACELGLPCRSMLERPLARDQRALGGKDRVANLEGRFRAVPEAPAGRRVLLVDDVFTTGSTLCAATDALRVAGAGEVSCLTFARV